MRKYWLNRYVLIEAVIIIIDQLSKYLINKHLSLYETVLMLPGLNLKLTHNKGAAFGFLAESGGWQRWLFVGIAFFIITLITYWDRKLKDSDKLERLALAFILGGAIGNLTDRIRYGYVIDFIDIYVMDWHWYTFNIADSAICIGAALLMFVCVRKD